MKTKYIKNIFTKKLSLIIIFFLILTFINFPIFCDDEVVTSNLYANAFFLYGNSTMKSTNNNEPLSYSGQNYMAGFNLGGKVTPYLALHLGLDLLNSYKMALGSDKNISDSFSLTSLTTGATFLLPKDIHLGLIFRNVVAGPSIGKVSNVEGQYDVVTVKPQSIGYAFVFTKEFDIASKGHFGFMFMINTDSFRYQRNTAISAEAPTGILPDINNQLTTYGVGLSLSIY